MPPLISNVEDLERVIDVMRAKKVLSLHVDGIAINLSPMALMPDGFGEPPKKLQRTDLKDPDNPTLEPIRERMNGEDVNEETLFHSSGGADAVPPGWTGAVPR